MYLQGKPPARMGFHSLNTGLHIGFSLFFIFLIARLQKTILGINVIILRHILAQIDYFQLIATFQGTRLHVTTSKSRFWRQRHPIKVRWDGTRTVGLDGDSLACLLFQLLDKSLVDKQGRLTTRQHEQRSIGILVDLFHNLLGRHQTTVLMLRVAKRTT